MRPMLPATQLRVRAGTQVVHVSAFIPLWITLLSRVMRVLLLCELHVAIGGLKPWR